MDNSREVQNLGTHKTGWEIDNIKAMNRHRSVSLWITDAERAAPHDNARRRVTRISCAM